LSVFSSWWSRCALEQLVLQHCPHLWWQAHWYYEDFCRTAEAGPALKSFSLREFAELMFAQHPSLERHKVRNCLSALGGPLPLDVTTGTGPPGRHLQAVHNVQGEGDVSTFTARALREAAA